MLSNRQRKRRSETVSQAPITTAGAIMVVMQVGISCEANKLTKCDISLLGLGDVKLGAGNTADMPSPEEFI